jgi:hypothetical protein
MGKLLKDCVLSTTRLTNMSKRHIENIGKKIDKKLYHKLTICHLNYNGMMIEQKSVRIVIVNF